MITKRTLNKAVKAAGNQTKLAEYLGFSRQFMSVIMRKGRPFPKRRIAALERLLNNGGDTGKP